MGAETKVAIPRSAVKPPAKRTRAPHQKSRNGCLICRQRRLKCDEKKPACDRCKNSSYECKWPQPLHNSLSILLSQEELRSLQYFRERTSSDLSGHWDQDFWTNAVLRLSYKNDTLQHFLVALGSFDESFRLRTDPGVDPDRLGALYMFSLQQYNIGIRSILQDPEIIAMPVLILTSSILCILYELWAGNMMTALQHLESAYRIQDGLMEDDLQGACGEQRHLLRTYIRPIILRNARQLRSRAQASPEMKEQPGAEFDDRKLDFESKQVFTCLAEAQADFQELSDHTIAGAVTLTKPVVTFPERDKLAKLKTKLEQWEKVFSRCPTPRDEDKKKEHMLLTIRYRAHRICLTAWAYNDEMIYDEHEEDFEAIVNIAGTYLKHHSEKSVPDLRRQHDSGTNMALSLVGTRCRDPYIRREAIRLLYRYWRLEGPWASLGCGMYCEVSMMLEEAGLGQIRKASDIPSDRRVRCSALEYDPGSLTDASEGCSGFENPPICKWTYRRPHSLDPHHIETMAVPYKVYETIPGFGDRSLSLWPDPLYWSDTLLDAEVNEEAKTRGGPHFGRKPWMMSENKDLESVCNLRLYSIIFEGGETPEDTLKEG